MQLPPENVYGHTKKLQYILKALEAVAAEKDDALVMDFGCGNGSAVSQFIIDKLPSNARYVGIDIHQPSIDFANSHYSKSNARFQLDLPTDGSCDLIVYADVLEHLDEPEAILKEHAALLKPGGIIVGSIPNGIGPYEIENSLDRRFKISQRIASIVSRVRGDDKSATPYNSDSGHLQFYRKRPFIQMLERAGFQMIEFKNGTFFGAMITERFLRFGGAPLMSTNTAVANVLPYWVVSTWLFTARRD